MTRKTKLLLGFGLGFAVLIGLGFAFGGPKDESNAFSWDTVSKGDIRETIVASGEIQAMTKGSYLQLVERRADRFRLQHGQQQKSCHAAAHMNAHRFPSR